MHPNRFVLKKSEINTKLGPRKLSSPTVCSVHENKRDLINIECRGGGWLYLSVNVYKIIAIIVLIPRDDDAYTMPENGNQMAVSQNRGRDGKRACCGTNEILKYAMNTRFIKFSDTSGSGYRSELICYRIFRPFRLFHFVPCGSLFEMIFALGGCYRY